MSREAYDEAYLDSMILKIRYLFKLIARNAENPFSVIETYMKCEYRRKMDLGNPLFLNKTPKQILGSIGIKIENPFEISEDWDESILEWMADIYTYMQWKDAYFSAEIVDKIPPGELYQKFSPLHEASLQNAVGKLERIYKMKGEKTL